APWNPGVLPLSDPVDLRRPSSLSQCLMLTQVDRFLAPQDNACEVAFFCFLLYYEPMIYVVLFDEFCEYSVVPNVSYNDGAVGRQVWPNSLKLPFFQGIDRRAIMQKQIDLAYAIGKQPWHYARRRSSVEMPSGPVFIGDHDADVHARPVTDGRKIDAMQCSLLVPVQRSQDRRGRDTIGYAGL